MSDSQFPAPSIRRRICVNLYEMMILLGVFAIGYLVPSLLLGIFFDIKLPNWLAFGQVYFLFAWYFTWYWTHTGQTLAMQTWNVKLLDTNFRLLRRGHALLRYAIASLWLLPTIVIYICFQTLTGKTLGHWPTIELMFCMILFFWPLTCYLDRSSAQERQSLVDRLCRTKLIQLPKSST